MFFGFMLEEITRHKQVIGLTFITIPIMTGSKVIMSWDQSIGIKIHRQNG
jgi:hypothetical protein